MSLRYFFISLLCTIELLSCRPKSSSENTSVTSGNIKTRSYQDNVNRYHDSISAIFYSGSSDVLPKKEINPLGRLNYFEPNETYKVKAVFQKIENGEVFKMKTSTDRLPEYRKYGTLNFFLNKRPFALTLYQNVELPEHIFCPFKDLSNGNETYGGGRYLDFTLSSLTNPILDFNYCYNPYCAYNPDYSCPIPPFENHLEVAIEAGEKKWH